MNTQLTAAAAEMNREITACEPHRATMLEAQQLQSARGMIAQAFELNDGEAMKKALKNAQYFICGIYLMKGATCREDYSRVDNFGWMVLNKLETAEDTAEETAADSTACNLHEIGTGTQTFCTGKAVAVISLLLTRAAELYSNRQFILLDLEGYIIPSSEWPANLRN